MLKSCKISSFLVQFSRPFFTEVNYDIRTIQTILMHTDVRTMMIYTHYCIPSKTAKEAKSVLEF